MTRRRAITWTAIAVVAAALIVARLLLGSWVTGYLNRKLDGMGDYHGHLERVELHLWRGAYTLHELRIVKREGRVPVPLLHVPKLDLSLSWRALAHGGIAGSAEFWSPEINLVDAKSRSSAQSGRGVDWREQLERLMPTRLDEVRVHDGTLHFRNFGSDPNVNLSAERIDGTVTNLTNVRDKARERAASFDLTARMLGSAPVESHAQFDPFAPLRDFRFAIKVTQVELKRANDFLQAYAKVDVASGDGDFVMELDSSKGRLTGYAKPLLRHVSVFNWEQDVEKQHDNPLRVLWESVAGGVENLFKNQSADQFATRIEIGGRIGDAKTDTLEAIAAVLRNAFVEAFKPQFEKLPTHRGNDDKNEKE